MIKRLENTEEQEVRAWLKSVIEEIGGGFHPDTSSDEYHYPITGSDGVNLDDGLSRIFDVYEEQTYDISLDVYNSLIE